MLRWLFAAIFVLSACTGSTDAPTASTPRPAPPSTSSRTPPGSRSVPADWPMYHRSLDRSGVSPAMPPVHAVKVLARIKLDEAMYASPVVVAGTVIAATEGDTVYALDTAGQIRWKQQLGRPSPAGELPCGNIDPLGITGTPVIDHRIVYVAAELGHPPRHQVVALDLRTGAIRWRRSLDLPGVETRAMQERGALTVSGGRVWAPFGGLLGDCGGYKGRLIGYRLDGTGPPVVFTVPTAREGGIWTAPGPSVDAAGNLFVAVGNGASESGDRYDFSDSVLKIGTDGKLRDSFSPRSWASDNANDRDLGSQGPALVGPWVFQAGKSGTAYVLRRSHLGGIGGQVTQAQVCVSYGGTAVGGSVVYVPCTDGVRAVAIDAAGRMHTRWHAAGSITGSPVVGGGRVWTVDPTAGVLHALDPRTGVSREQADVGPTSRFATPAIYGRNVFVPTLAGLCILGTS